jgi:hypothetical protein
LWLQGLLAGVVLESTLGYAVEAPAPPGGTFSGTVTLRDETLAIRVTAVPLKQVMAELSRQSGAPIRWLTAGGEELISVDFPALPLADALERLLGKKNFLLFYTTAADGLRLTHIWISSGETSQGRPLSEHGAVPEAMTPSLPLGQSLPSHGGDSRLSQTITEARPSLVGSGPVTQARSGTPDELMKNAISFPMVHSDNTPQGQDNAATSGLFGGAAPSVPGVSEHCLPDASATHFADVTSEGRADAIAINTRGITVRTSDGRQFLLSQSWTATPYFGQGGTYFADVTGDGRADAIAVNTDQITVRSSTGAGFLFPQAWTIGPYYGDLSLMCTN